MKTTKINFAIKSKRGKRPVNQDSLVCTYNKNSDFIAICCDGVGSVKGSEYASKLICSVFALEFEKTSKIDKPIIWTKQTLEFAINKLKLDAQARGIPDIATTFAMLMIVGNKYYAFNVGDTRIYGISNRKTAVKLSTDHNFYNYLLKKHVPNRTLTINKSRWYSLTRYIESSRPDKAKLDYVSGDTSIFRYFVICTDGLYQYVKSSKMAKVCFAKCLPLVCRSSWLNRAALNQKSDDNVSNVVVSCKVYGK